eukprot:g3618.t1
MTIGMYPRQKQIEFGYNTKGYDNYTRCVPRRKRRGYRFDEPYTPDKTQKYSKRQWQGMIRKWRRTLHMYDNREPPPSSPAKEAEAAELVETKKKKKTKPSTETTTKEPTSEEHKKSAETKKETQQRDDAPAPDADKTATPPPTSATAEADASKDSDFEDFEDDDLL